jgi:D-ribulokinase
MHEISLSENISRQARNNMDDRQLLAIGLDLGTGGARAVAVDFSGQLIAEGCATFPSSATHIDGPCVEQDSYAWTTAAHQALRALAADLPRVRHIVGIAVDATSGSFLLVDRNDRPITPGLMYNDLRAAELAAEVAAALRESLEPYGIQITPAFALAKIVYLARHEPALFARCQRIVHQTDWILGMLSGRLDVTDISTALKTGADPGRLAWPDAMETLGIGRSLLPGIVLPGTPVGQVTAAAAEATGLTARIPVVAGCTDGTAGCLASGASAAGDLNVTLRTTMVFKAIAEQPLFDPAGIIYNHRHPAGGFLPGAASSTGCDWIARNFGGTNLVALGQQAKAWLPGGPIVYPLVKTGERFPFACRQATGFGLEAIDNRARRLAAGMEAVAYLERMGIGRMEQLGLAIGPTLYATGGGVASETWLKIRASVMERTYSVPRHPACAVGAAVLAALPYVGDYRRTAQALVHAGHQVEPDLAWSRIYHDYFERFQAALSERGYLRTEMMME